MNYFESWKFKMEEVMNITFHLLMIIRLDLHVVCFLEETEPIPHRGFHLPTSLPMVYNPLYSRVTSVQNLLSVLDPVYRKLPFYNTFVHSMGLGMRYLKSLNVAPVASLAFFLFSSVHTAKVFDFPSLEGHVNNFSVEICLQKASSHLHHCFFISNRCQVPWVVPVLKVELRDGYCTSLR
ncbi:hypothetical protein M514_03132 [Trichuris suis]|uniref:Uncharacterized protein n=1 Tax=Trichuris suis TaxID=68888 RepID=A0A085NFJ0_9BILA|nr:hypothetical protein M514_03132 [Trichuris suis]